MMKGTTKTGFEYEFDETIFDDIEFVELLAEADSNGMLIPKFTERMLGKEQKKRLYDHVRDENGRASLTRVKEEILDMMTTEDETKNL